MRLLEFGDQFLGEILLGLRPQNATANGAVLLDGVGEGDQLGDVGAHVLFDLRRDAAAFVKERRVQTKVDFDVAVVGAIEAITDIDRLELLTEKILKAATWQELLDTP